MTNNISGHATGTDSLEVPTLYKAYFLGLNLREYPQKIWPYMVRTYLHFRILQFPLIIWDTGISLGFQKENLGLIAKFSLLMDHWRDLTQ